MSITNRTFNPVSEFVLLCFKGIGSWQHLISISLTFLLLLTLTANITLLSTIYSAPSLHHPMYYYLCLLAVVDLLLSFAISPRTLSFIWFNAETISSVACFAQVYFIFFCQGMEAGFTLFLAYDRYIAVCIPLRYSSIVTNKLSAHAAAIIFAGNFICLLPFPILASELHYCRGNTISNCFCEFASVAKLACGDTTVVYTYSLAMLITFMIMLTIGLAFSYTMIVCTVLRMSSTESKFKAFSTCSSHLSSLLIVYCILIITAISFRISKLLPQYAHILLALLRYLILPAFNLLVYGIRTQEIRQALRRLLMKAIQKRSET